MSDTKKLLRFGTDQPRCSKCGATDRRCLCRLPQGRNSLTLCRNCRAERKRLSPEAKARKIKRSQDAGYDRPACIICNHRSLKALELDHLAGKANSDLQGPLCANCHAIKSYEAESGPMASLRRRDPHRSALAFQAAFDFGLAAILGAMAATDSSENVARAVFLGLVAAALVVWGCWNFSADEYFQGVLGPGYDQAIPVPVPR